MIGYVIFKLWWVFLWGYGITMGLAIVLFIYKLRKLKSTVATKLFIATLCLYYGSFCLWIADQWFCPILQPFKFHALWHIGAGYGLFVFLFFVFCLFVCLSFCLFFSLSVSDFFAFLSFFFVPNIIRPTTRETERKKLRIAILRNGGEIKNETKKKEKNKKKSKKKNKKEHIYKYYVW